MVNNDYENIISQIRNSGKLNSIEEIYLKIEAEEQRRYVMIDKICAMSNGQIYKVIIPLLRYVCRV